MTLPEVLATCLGWLALTWVLQAVLRLMNDLAAMLGRVSA